MRQSIRRFVELCAQTLPMSGPLYEFGALQVANDDPAENLRPLFPDHEYIGCDMRPGAGVDRILDLHEIALDNEVAGAVLSMDTLEHVEYPRRALGEIHRILKPGGIVILSSVMAFPIHGYPNDYWRFTPEGFRSLLKQFENSFIGQCGANPDFPQTVVGVGFKGDTPDLTRFEKAYGKWEHWNNEVLKKIEKNYLSSES